MAGDAKRHAPRQTGARQRKARAWGIHSRFLRYTDFVPADARDDRRLLNIFGTTFGVAITIGAALGSGILRTAGHIAAELPTVGAFFAVWIAGGAYAILGANAFSELGTMFSRSGGPFVFVHRALGHYAGFLSGWIDWIARCGVTAAIAIVAGEYAVVLVPAFRSEKMIALLLVALFTSAQWLGSSSSGRVQIGLTAIKVAALLLFAAACFWLGGRDPSGMALEPDAEGSIAISFLLALQAVIYSFEGWSSAVYFSEEMKNPAKNIPRAMLGGVLGIIAIYLAINAAMLRVVPLATLAGQPLAGTVVAQHLFGAAGDGVLRVVMLLTLLGAVHANIMIAPRVMHAMGKAGMFWRGASEVNRRGTPDVALLVSGTVAALFVMSSGFLTVMGRVAFLFVLNHALSFVSLFVLRSREAGTPRPFRAWGHPWTSGAALLISGVFLISALIADARAAAIILVLALLAVPASRLVRVSPGRTEVF